MHINSMGVTLSCFPSNTTQKIQGEESCQTAPFRSLLPELWAHQLIRGYLGGFGGGLVIHNQTQDRLIKSLDPPCPV